jgi:hypothetical protein
MATTTACGARNLLWAESFIHTSQFPGERSGVSSRRLGDGCESRTFLLAWGIACYDDGERCKAE